MTTDGRPALTGRLFAVLGLVAMLAPLATSFYLLGLPALAADLGATVLNIDRPVPSGLGIVKPPELLRNTDLSSQGRLFSTRLK